VVALEAVEIWRAGRRILGPLSLVLAAGGVTILIGPNGSGKTSLLRALHGLERISRGRILWPGDQATLRARQAFVFQTPVLMRRSVVDCIAYPLILRGESRGQARGKAAEMASGMGLEASLYRPASVLSGGERQKMALARALIRGPEVLFLDEPCANLDTTSTREIEALLAAAREGGTRIIMSTHDLGQARRLADDVVLLHEGAVIEQGDRRFFDGPATPAGRAFLNGELL
jgi:tungstate transport system ATP-binding protein